MWATNNTYKMSKITGAVTPWFPLNGADQITYGYEDGTVPLSGTIKLEGSMDGRTVYSTLDATMSTTFEQLIFSAGTVRPVFVRAHMTTYTSGDIPHVKIFGS